MSTSGTKTRQLKVYKKAFPSPVWDTGSCTFYPQIKLQGKWLQDSGFECGQTLNITCEKGRVIITPAETGQFDDG